MIWAILGIDETKDKKAITRAYRDKLQTVNPEEKPEQFKQLRAAYEEALRLADEGEAKNEPQTACQRWLAKAKAVYNDLPCRLSVDCWKELLADDFCQGIDTRMEAEEALLGFFHTSYRLPQRVWQYLDGEFSWQERMSELYEIYEKDFVDYVIAGGLRTGTGEILELFAPGTDGTKVDDYVSLVVRLSSLPFEEWQQPYETLKALKVRNPYGDSLCLRYDHYRGDESAVERMALLADLYPESLQVLLQGALLSREAGRNGDAIRYCEKAAAIDMDLPWAHEIWAYSLADQGDYRGAVRKLNVVMGLSDGNQKRLYELNELRIQWSDHLLQSYRQAVEDDPNDADALFELCWCYVQRDEDDAAAALADRLKEDFPDRFSYHNLMSILTTITCQWEKSLQHIEQVLQAIGQMDPAGTEEEVRRIRRASEFETRRARVLLSMDRKEEAYAMFDQIAAENPSNGDVLTEIAGIYLDKKEYDKAEPLLVQLTRLLPGSYYGFALLASCLLETGQDSRAFDAVNTALELDGSDLSAYHIKLRILVRNGAFEPAQELIAFLEENGIEKDPVVLWSRAAMARSKDRDEEGALALFQEADAQLADHPVKPVWVAAFYFEMALCLANVKDAKKDYSRADILQVLDKGLAVDPSSYDCREYKAWLLKKDSRYEEALAIYKELEAMPRQSLYIEEQMAEIYYNKAYFYADKAYDYYKRLEEDKNASPEYHMDLAYCSYRMMEFDRVREECKKALALDSDQPYAYYLMGLAALVESRLEEALLFGDKAIELAKKQDRVPGLFWSVKIRALRRMDRLKDAVDAIMDRSRYATDDPHTYSDLIAVSMQDGSYGSAMKLVHLLRRKKLHEGLAAETTAIVEIFSGRYKKAQKVLDSEEEAMGFDEKHMIRSLLAAAEGDFSVLEDYRRKALTRAENDDIADPFAQWTNLAMALWLGDKTEEAAEAAFRALQIIGQAEKRFSLDVPIRLGHQAVCLALTGDEAGARQALADMQDAPKCDFCGYPTCKDHTVYTCEAEMILGNTDKAASMLYFSLKGFPDEEVFLLLKFYLMKKGVL